MSQIHVSQIKKAMEQSASLTSRLIALFRLSNHVGIKEMNYMTQNRYLPWHVLPRQDGKYPVANNFRKIVCICYIEDDANHIVREHNKTVKAREDWLFARNDVRA